MGLKGGSPRIIRFTENYMNINYIYINMRLRYLTGSDVIKLRSANSRTAWVARVVDVIMRVLKMRMMTS